MIDARCRACYPTFCPLSTLAIRALYRYWICCCRSLCTFSGNSFGSQMSVSFQTFRWCLVAFNDSIYAYPIGFCSSFLFTWHCFSLRYWQKKGICWMFFWTSLKTSSFWIVFPPRSSIDSSYLWFPLVPWLTACSLFWCQRSCPRDWTIP